MNKEPGEATETLASLAERIARLEHAIAQSRSGTSGDSLSQALSLPFDLDDSGADVVTYTGHGMRQDDPIAWRVKRSWQEVLGVAGDGLTTVLSALAAGPRLRIVAELVHGPVATGDLVERLGLASTGQLFHHLKELLAVGIVHQPQRGVYAIRPARIIPVLAILSAAIDLAPNLESSPAPDHHNPTKDPS